MPRPTCAATVCPSARRRFGDRAIAEALEGRQLLTSYYFSPTGSDTANVGTSSASPWQTIAKANTLDLNAGDQLLFQGGQTFAGTVQLGAEDAGTSATPVVVGSYGSGRATISAGTGKGVSVYNAAGVDVKNLVITGSGRASGNTVSGVEFYTDLPSATKLARVRVDNLDVSGFGSAGIVIGAYPADQSKSGFADVRITNTASHDNADAGVSTYGYFRSSATGYAHSSVYVGNVRAYNNLGIANKGANSGSGIVLSDVDGATIERCVAYNNGQNNNFAGGGPVGIWAYDANAVTIQHNESYANKSSTGDGGGFDLDGGVTNSFLQYNYSHDNAGPGILVAQFPGARPMFNNVIRYNVSQNDARTNGGAIRFWNGTSTAISNFDVYHNTVYLSPPASGSPAAVDHLSGSATGLRLRNNVFVTTGGLRVLNIPSNTAAYTFQGNAYWSSGSAFAVRWGATTYASLSAWRTATGQERNGAVDVGLQADPQFRTAGGGGTLNDANKLSTLTAYKLQRTSPLRDTGLDLTASPFNLTVGARDYYGSPLKQNGRADVGAHEAVPAPWLSEDVGAVAVGGAAGTTNASNSAFTVTGAGVVSTQASDTLQFVYQSLTGDGQIVARVASVQNTNNAAKGLLMMRESLAAGARHATVALRPGTGGGVFISRATANATAAAGTTVAATVPYWLRMVRAGNVFTGYVSANGTTWTPAGSATIAMGTTVLVGLGAASNVLTTAGTATFDNVAVTGGANLLANAGFESGLAPWTTGGPASRVAIDARTGTYAGALTGAGGGLYYALSGLLANTTYVFRGFAKAAAGETVFLGVKEYGGAERNVTLTSTAYTQGYVTFTTGASSTTALLYAYKSAGAGTSLVDDLELTLA